MFGVLLFLGCALNAATGEAVPEMAGFARLSTDCSINGISRERPWASHIMAG